MWRGYENRTSPGTKEAGRDSEEDEDSVSAGVEATGFLVLPFAAAAFFTGAAFVELPPASCAATVPAT